MSKFCYSDNVQIKEGSAKLFIPRQALTDPHHCKVFYNQAMAFNRSLSCLFISSALNELKTKKATIFDGYSATGIRGIRYAIECNVPIKKVVLCEANDDAMPYLEKNIKLNKLRNATIAHSDVNKFLAKRKFDVIELDPFGSPLPALDSAFSALNVPGILSLTFTDLANLCGGKRDQVAKCIKEYQAKPMRCIFSHELALRIALGKVARVASEHRLSVEPLACWYEGHYVKLILKVEKGGKQNKNQGFAWLCRNCLSRGIGVKNKCSACGAKTQISGPLWVEKLGEESVLAGVLEKNKEEKVRKFVEKLLGELNAAPLFYNVEEFSSLVGSSTPRLANVVAALNRNGFAAVATHFSPTGFKTSASAGQIKKIIAERALRLK